MVFSEFVYEVKVKLSLKKCKKNSIVFECLKNYCLLLTKCMYNLQLEILQIRHLLPTNLNQVSCFGYRSFQMKITNTMKQLYSELTRVILHAGIKRECYKN